MKRVLVLGAHPDDEMGCAGTVARLVEEGAQVDVIAFSRCSDLIPSGFSESDLIEEFMVSTHTILGTAKARVLDVPNRRFPEFRQDILAELDSHRRANYELVLAPASSDAHQDHSTVMAEAIRVFKHTNLWGYELPMNTVRQSTFSCYVKLEQRHVDAKINVIRAYRSQAFRPYMTDEFVRGIVAVRGVQAGVRYAEAFEVVRCII